MLIRRRVYFTPTTGILLRRRALHASRLSNFLLLNMAGCQGYHQELQSKRFKWSPELHKGFVSSIFEIGLLHASPKAVWANLQEKDLIENGVLTPRHIKSHLQKYRHHRKRSKQEFLEMYGQNFPSSPSNSNSTYIHDKEMEEEDEEEIKDNLEEKMILKNKKTDDDSLHVEVAETVNEQGRVLQRVLKNQQKLQKEIKALQLQLKGQLQPMKLKPIVPYVNPIPFPADLQQLPWNIDSSQHTQSCCLPDYLHFEEFK